MVVKSMLMIWLSLVLASGHRRYRHHYFDCCRLSAERTVNSQMKGNDASDTSPMITSTVNGVVSLLRTP